MQRIDMKAGRVLRGTTAAAMVAVALLSGCADKPEALVVAAKEYLAKNERNSAVIQLKNALQKDPDLAEARFLLGKTLLETGDFAAAEKELRKARELKFPADEIVPLLARALVSQGEFKKAIDEFSKVDVTAPEHKAELQSALGQARMAMGDREAARAAFAAAVSAVPDYTPALLGQVRIKAGTGDLPGALMLLETAMAKSPTLADGWQLKGDILNAQGQIDDALAAYRKALAARTDSLPAHSSIVTTLIRQGKTDDAGTQLEAMKKLAPKNPQTLYLQALLAFQQKNYVAAREAVQQQLRAAPDNLLGLLLDGRIELQLGSYAQAETSLAKVLQRVPKQRFARIMLVNTYLRTGQRTKALDALKPLLGEADADSSVLALAGEVYAQNGDIAEAERFFEKAAKLDPKDSQTRAALALSHVAMGDGERGFRELEEAAADDTGIRADLALIAANIRQRKFDAALTAIEALEKKQPDKPLPYNLRGAVLAAKADKIGARRSFERATVLDPADFGAAANLAKLDLAEKKPDDAKKRFEAVLAKDPKNVRALLAMAEMRAQAGGTLDEVAALIGKAVTADPTNATPRLVLVAYYLRITEPKKAVAAAQDALAALPDNPSVLDALGQAQQATGDINQAIAAYNKLAQLRPGSPEPLMRLAGVQLAARDREGALQSLRKALAIKPDLIEAQRAMITTYLDTGRGADALAVAREVQKQRPKESIGYVLEGDSHASKRAWRDAAGAYRNGLTRVGTTDLAVRLDAALRASDNNSDADRFDSGWLKDHPKDRAFRAYLAESATMNKDFAGAAQQYRTMLDFQPNDALALNNLAYVAGQLKDPKALEYAEKADQLMPNNPAILDTMGMLLIDKGDTKRGVEIMKRAAGLAPNAAAIHLNLARALVKDGQKDAAKKELDAIAKLGDKFSGQAEVARLMQGL